MGKERIVTEGRLEKNALYAAQKIRKQDTEREGEGQIRSSNISPKQS